MKLKTYGVSGLIDFTTQIKSGKCSVSVHFTGGALTAYGVTPAKFSTSNPMFQHIIENSEQFKNNRIILLGEIEVKGKENTTVNKQKNNSNSSADNTVIMNPPKGEELSMNPESVVEVADKYDAIEYLKEHFPEKKYTSTGLRTDIAFDAACNDCGIKFVFKS